MKTRIMVGKVAILSFVFCLMMNAWILRKAEAGGMLFVKSFVGTYLIEEEGYWDIWTPPKTAIFLARIRVSSRILSTTSKVCGSEPDIARSPPQFLISILTPKEP